jgi:hypothetical protein
MRFRLLTLLCTSVAVSVMMGLNLSPRKVVDKSVYFDITSPDVKLRDEPDLSILSDGTLIERYGWPIVVYETKLNAFFESKTVNYVALSINGLILLVVLAFIFAFHQYMPSRGRQR